MIDMKTIDEQIAGKCIFFNGLLNKFCNKGIEYDSFGRVKMNVIPCIAGGTASCEHRQFPTAEDVEEKVKKMTEASGKALGLLFAARNHFEKTGNVTGKFKCPYGDHDVMFVRAELNGHYWVKCRTCQVSFNE